MFYTTHMKKFSTLHIFDNLNHDIKSPIASIQSVISILGQSGKEKSAVEVAEYHSRIIQKLEFLNTTVDTLYDLVFLQENKLELYPEFISFSELLKTSISRISYTETHFEVRIPAENEEVLVVGDRQRLQQVLKTVLEVIMRLKKPESTSLVTVSLQDQTPENTSQKMIVTEFLFSGEQIPPEEENQLFDLAYTFEKQREKKIFPILHVAAELAKLHKGQLTYTRKNDSSGVFVLELPLKS